MRRRDREVKDIIVIKSFIQKESIIRIAFYDKGEIYIVPVNYGYLFENNKHIFYFHGAKAGRKYELSKSMPIVGFEIDGNYELLNADIACDYSAKFQSVIGNGKVEIIEDSQEKMKALLELMKHNTGKTEWEFDEKMLKAVCGFKLVVEEMSCKEHE